MSSRTAISSPQKITQGKSFLISVLFGILRFVNMVIHQVLGVKATCRYEVTCSTYAMQTIEKKGILKGGILSLRRVLNCQPYFKI